MADKQPDAAKRKRKSSTSGKSAAAKTSAAAVQEPAESCCAEPEQAQTPAPATACCAHETPVQSAPATESGEDANLAAQRISGILKAVLEDVPPPAEPSNGKRFRYPWYMDAVMAVGLLLAVGGFTIGLFKMYLTHKAQVCIREQNYQAAIALLKGNPLPPMFNTLGEEDPQELLARALYLDAMKKMDDGDTRGGLAELQQIRAGTQEFDHAQKILADNFEPSSTQLTGGVVQNDATAANR